MIDLILVGALGRMGKAVEEAAAAADDLRIKARIDTASPPEAKAAASAPSDLLRIVESGDVVIEFSSPEGTRNAASACARSGAALVSGTTGLSAADEALVRDVAQSVAVLRSANFSLGVLALRRALATAIENLPDDWDIEIVERHHRLKTDSPSGTALLLARDAASLRGQGEPLLRYGREGRLGPRGAGEIGVHAVRGGTWVGDHAVLLAGRGECLEIRHAAQDRSAFASGVLFAARFVATAAPGLYNLEDVPLRDRAG